MKKIHHFYHIYASGMWETPAIEHVKALNDSGLMSQISTFNFGLVGKREDQDRVEKFLEENFPSINIVARAEEGFEQETMDAIYDYAKDHSGYVLYAHTKNAMNVNDTHIKWRKSMTYFTVIKWKDCVRFLEEGFSAVGSHYLLIKNNSLVENISNVKNELGVFAGTFWWTDLDFIKSFSKKAERYDRFGAEHWISNLKSVVENSGKEFKVYDFNPYHPGSKKGMVDSW
jgi:hypothetical protein